MSNPMPPPPPPPKSNNTKYIIIGVVIIAVIIGAYVFVDFISPSGSIQAPYTLTVVNTNRSVNAASYTGYTFDIPLGSTNIQVTGSFTAYGGSGNDAKVYILDSTNYAKYQNSQSFSPIYYSGQVHTQSITATLPSSGTYYLIIDNMFSLLTSKVVSIQVTVNYKL